MESNKKYSKEHIYKTEKKHKDFKINLRVTKGEMVVGGGINWEDGINIYILSVCKIDNKQGPTV